MEQKKIVLAKRLKIFCELIIQYLYLYIKYLIYRLHALQCARAIFLALTDRHVCSRPYTIDYHTNLYNIVFCEMDEIIIICSLTKTLTNNQPNDALTARHVRYYRAGSLKQLHYEWNHYAVICTVITVLYMQQFCVYYTL